ncbi:hypothetical protein, partial [Streptomyces mauvecolor]
LGLNAVSDGLNVVLPEAAVKHYLPASRQAVNAWLAGFAGTGPGRQEELGPAVAALKQVIEADANMQMLTPCRLKEAHWVGASASERLFPSGSSTTTWRTPLL